MRAPRKLYRCRNGNGDAAYSEQCDDFVGDNKCPGCKGEDVYVRQQRKRKAVR